MTRRPSASASRLTLLLSMLTTLVTLAGTAVAQSPVPFVDQPLVPDAAAPGGAGFTLTVNGAGFVPASIVNWNGSPLPTTFVKSTQLTATVPSSNIATASTASVTVVNPSPGGVSNTQFFSIAAASTSLSFLPAVTYDSGGYTAQSVRIADLKADGKLDIVVANWWDTNNIGVVGILLGNGDGTFQPAMNYKTGGAPNYSLVVADVNGDGKLDLIVSSCAVSASTCGSADGVVSVLLGNGDGTFQHALTYGSGAPVGAHVAVADVDGDGKPDLIATSYQGQTNGDGTVAVLFGNGDGTFQLPVLYDSGAPGANAVTVADVNGDGVLDLLVANGCFSNCAGGLQTLTILSVLLGNGDGTFQPALTYATGAKTSGWISVADLTGDGRLDAVLSSLNIGSASGTVSILLGVGNGTFEPAVTYDSGGYAAPELALADLNANGRLDIVVDNCGPVGGCGTGLIGVLGGRGDGTFDPVVAFSSGAYNATSIAVADLNGDGRLDLVAANQCAMDGCTTGSVSVLLNNTSASPCVGRCATSTTISSNLNPSIRGQAITFSATVTSAGGTPPNGETVTFYNGSGILGTAPLNGGIASLTKSSLPPGIHTISAAYLGDANFTSSTSPALEQAVDTSSQSPTTTALASSLNPSTYGQKITWTATVTTSGKTIPTGKVTFNWDGQSVGTATLNAGGVATLTRSNLNADPYPLTAVYLGDANNGPSASPILNQIVQQTTSAATISSSLNPSNQGQSVTFTAKITSPTTTPTGPVTFTAGKTVLGTVELSNSKATFTTSTLATGSTTITVTFDGDSNIHGSSASLTQVVQQSISSGTSSTALTYTEDPSTQAETFTAMVTSSSGTPSGTVTFTVGSITLGTVALTSGKAVLNTTTLAVGSNTVTATYSGNSEIAASSAWVTQTFVMPVSGALYLQQEGGSAAATTTFGLGTSSANLVPYYTGLPNSPNPTGELLVGTFPAGTLINFGMYTTFGSQSGYAFSTGTDQASLVSFADLSNSLGMDHGITQQTSSTTWLLHLDDALSYLYDDDNNDVLMELIVVPN